MTEKMEREGCTRAGCHGIAAYLPIVSLRSTQPDEPVEVHFNLGVCGECRDSITLPSLMSAQGWQVMKEIFASRGLLPPDAELTELLYEAIEGP